MPATECDVYEEDLEESDEVSGSSESESSPSEAASPSSTCGPPETWFEPLANGVMGITYEEVDGVANLSFIFVWPTILKHQGGWWSPADKTCVPKGWLWHPWNNSYYEPIDIGVPDWTFVESWAEIGGSPCGSRTAHSEENIDNFNAVGEAACQVSTGLSPGQLDVSVFTRISNGQTFSRSYQIDL